MKVASAKAGHSQFLTRTDGLIETVSGLLASEEGRREWPLCFYDPKTLFSVEARRGWVEPDLGELPSL